jgi:hypothetical protein
VGLVFGASETHLVGRVSNIRSASDVGGMGPPVLVSQLGRLARSCCLNEKGAVLSLSGRLVGLIANVELSGLAISLNPDARKPDNGVEALPVGWCVIQADSLRDSSPVLWRAHEGCP